MAKIVYKKGLEGQNKIDCIEGIEIEMMNGQCAFIYPKYADLPMADVENIKEYKEFKISEIDAMKAEDSTGATNKLIALGSPAAGFVRQFNSNIHGPYNLPTLVAAVEISCQSKDINIIAKTIEGADLIEDDPEVSSCFQATDLSMWFAYNGGFVGTTWVDFPTTSVPTIVYKKRRMRKVSSWMTDASVPTTVYKKPQTVYMVTSERAEKEDLQSLIDETKLFASFDDAKEYAKRKFEEVLKIFGVTKDNVKVEESEKENSEELYSIHSNFLYSGHEWDIWVTIQEKEIQ